MERAEQAVTGIKNENRIAGLGSPPIDDVARIDPGMARGDAVCCFSIYPDAIHAEYTRFLSAASAATRSSVGGWVENSFMNAEPLNGLMMNMCAVAGDASIGMRCDHDSSFFNPLMSPSGVPVYLAAVASAANSRVREIAI